MKGVQWEPLPYQERAVQHLVERSNAGLFLKPGMRKTSITLAAFKVLRSLKMAKVALVIAPLRVIYTSWPQEVKKWTDFNDLSYGILHGTKKGSVLKEKHDIYLINYEGLPWLLEQLLSFKSMPFDYLVVDECFATGTLVATPTGSQPIETLRVGDYVLTSSGPQKVFKLSTRKVQTMVKLKLSSGVEITCTEDHPFFTDNGWICARDTKNAKTYGTADLSNLQNRVSGISEQNTVWNREGVLLKILRSEEEVSRQLRLQKNYRCSIFKGACWQAIMEQGKNLVYRSAQKAVSLWETAKSQVYDSARREWYRANKARSSTSNCTTNQVYLELPNSIGWEARRLSYKLQSRLRRPELETSYRGGWQYTQQSSSKGEGQKENSKTKRTWVEGVTHLESASGFDVWNLEVENTPNYFANGCLVHNCTKLKNTSSTRFKLLKPWLRFFKRRVILTGSPMANRLLDVFGQAYIMDSGATFGQYITHFKNEYFLPIDDFGNVVPKAGTEELIHARLAPRVYYAHRDDWLKLPKLIEKDIFIDLPPKAMAAYMQMENALRLDFEKGIVVAANTGVATMKCRQISNGGVYLDAQQKTWEHIHDAKTDAVLDLIDELQGAPALITYEFLHDLDRLKKALGKDTPHIGKGGVSPKQMTSLIASWNRGGVPYIIVNEQSMSHGVDGLQEAGRAVIWHSLTYNFENYDQLISRLQRSGQRERVLVAHIISNTMIDKVLMATVRRKDKMQGNLFAALKEYWVTNAS